MKGIGSLRRLFWVMMALAPAGMFLLVVTAAAQSANPKLAAMIKKAAKEGVIVYQGPDPITREPAVNMLRAMSAVTKKHFGVDIKLKIDNALSFPASTAKALTEIMAGAPPTFDLMIQTPVSGSPLLKANALVAVPWLELFPYIKSKDLATRGYGVITLTQFVLPSYNTKLVKPKDVPKTWNDLLDPKWKGKIGMLIYPDPWKNLAQPNAWGEEKTFDYLKKLMRLNPKLGRFPEVHQRVASGETPLTWGAFRERTLYNKKKGAPVEVAGDVEPSQLWIYTLIIPKGARHPNAAALVAAAMLTKEGQDLQQKFAGSTSMFRPNTSAAKFVAGRKYIKPDLEFHLRRGAELSKKIRAIMVRRK